MIVDDEALARDAIRLRLHNEPDIEVVGEAGMGPTPWSWCDPFALTSCSSTSRCRFWTDSRSSKRYRPSICRSWCSSPRTIECALKAFETHAVDYLLKPFTASRFHAALDRARLEVARAGDHETHQRLIEVLDERRRARERRGSQEFTAGEGYLARLAVKHNERICARQDGRRRLDRVVRQLRPPAHSRQELCRPHDDGRSRTPARPSAVCANSPIDDRPDRPNRRNSGRLARRLRCDSP